MAALTLSRRKDARSGDEQRLKVPRDPPIYRLTHVRPWIVRTWLGVTTLLTLFQGCGRLGYEVRGSHQDGGVYDAPPAAPVDAPLPAAADAGDLAVGSPEWDASPSTDITAAADMSEAPVLGAPPDVGAPADAVGDLVPSPSVVGCADGTREGFVSVGTHTAIAGCSGGWQLPGIRKVVAPACDRKAGNDGANPEGQGCNAEDLCAIGWHICRDRNEVAARAVAGCAPVVEMGAGEAMFFATGQASLGFDDCNDFDVGDNDLFGCGDIGVQAKPSCAPLDRGSAHGCAMLGSPWECGDVGDEALRVTKRGPARGGVLCCRD